MRWVLRNVEAGRHRRFAAKEGILGIVAGIIAFRGKSKLSAIIAACKAARDLLDANPELENVELDTLVAALVTAKANPPKGRGAWARPPHWGVCNATSAGKIGGTLSTAIADLGFRAGAWPALAAVRRNLGCGKAADPSGPIFAWEVGGPGIIGRTVWERAALASTAFLCVSGARPGTMGAASLHNVARVDGQCVWMTFPLRSDDAASDEEEPFSFKDDRRTAMKSPGRTRGLILDNWRIARYLIPWISLLRFLKFSDHDRLFPAIVDARRSKDLASPVVEGFRLLRRRSWSSQERIAIMDYVLGGRRAGRTANGFRHGQTVEFNALGIRPEVRFRCQLRSLKPIVGSEAAYDRVIEDSARTATRALGSRRIVQGTVGLVTVATSASRGSLSDWVAHDPVGVSAAISSYTCQKCGSVVEEDDEEGALCDTEGCMWGLCSGCHPDTAAPLSCPLHADAS